MEFRITGIEEIASDVVGRDKIVLALENVPSENEARTTGRYTPVARITATVPYDSEFYNAVIGMRVSFGVPSTNNPGLAEAPASSLPQTKPVQQYFSYPMLPAEVAKYGLAGGFAGLTSVNKAVAATIAKDTSVVYVLPPHVGNTVQFPSGAVVTDPGLAGNITWSNASDKLRKELAKSSDARPKQSELVEASTIFLCSPTEPHYMVDFKKYPESYVENLVREDQKRKAQQEWELEIQKQTAKAAAEIDRVRIEFAKSDKVDPRFKLWSDREGKL